jgi:hypothetical protein
MFLWMGELMYCLNDFEESLKIARPESKPVKVLLAWGQSSEGWQEWGGGFLMLLEDGRYAYLTGWCDATGWGCQDGAEINYSNSPRGFADLSEDICDVEPADLNKWLAEGMKAWEDR